MGAVVEGEVDLGGELVQVELGRQGEVGLLEAVSAPQIEPAFAIELPVDVEIRVVERRVGEKLAPGHALQLGHREAPVRQHVALGLEDAPRQVGPGPAREAHAEWQGVEEDPEDPLAVLLLRPAVGDQAGDHVPATGAQAHGLHVRRQKDAFQRHAGRPGQALQRTRRLG